MPRIEQNQTGGRIIFDADDFLEGLNLQYDAPSSPAQRIGNGFASATGLNPYRFLGYASPGFFANDCTNVSQVAAYIRNGVPNGTYAYLIGSGALLHQLNVQTATPTLTSDATWPHTITHGGHTSIAGEDIVIYNANIGGTSAARLFYSWNDNTDWNVGTYDFAATFDDDFMTTVPAGTLLSGATTPTLASGAGKPHPLTVGSDDILYMGDQNYVHAYDGNTGANGTFTAAVLTLPLGFTITSFARTSNFLMIFAYRAQNAGTVSTLGGFYYGETRCYAWDYISLDPTYVYTIDDNYVSEAFEYQGTVGCFTRGRTLDLANTDRNNRVQIFNGAYFEPLFTFSATAVPGRGGVNIIDRAIQWNSNGDIFQYGSNYPGLPVGLQKIGKVTNGVSAGVLKSFTSRDLYISAGAGAGLGMEYLRTGSYYDQASFNTVLAQPDFPQGNYGRVKRVKIAFAKTNTSTLSASISVSLYSDGFDTTSSIINAVSTINSTNLVKEYMYTDGGAELPVFNALQLQVNWNSATGTGQAPIIKNVEIEYENVVDTG